jgi:cardiolipin synthase
VVKELLMIVGGAGIIKKGKALSSSKWFGKLATVVFFLVMTSIILFNMDCENGNIVVILILISLAFMIFSFFMYLSIFFKLISKKNNINN